MILYQVTNMHMLLIFAIHKMRNNQEKGAILYPEWFPIGWPKDEDLKKIFDEVCGYKNFWRPYPTDVTSVKKYGDWMFRNLFLEELEEFDTIYVSAMDVPFHVYLTIHNIHYNFVEDSPGWYFTRLEWLKGFTAVNSAAGNMIKNLGIGDLSSHCIDKIFTDIPTGIEVSDPRVIPFSENDLLESLTSEEISRLDQVFLPSGVDDIQLDHCTLLAPMAFGIAELFDTMNGVGSMTSLVLDYFKEEESRLLIKAHMADKTNYQVLYPDAYVFPSNCPMELIMLHYNLDNIQAIGVSTSSISKLFKNVVSFPAETRKPYRFYEWIQKAHKYYAIRCLYAEASKDRPWDFWNLGTHDPEISPGFFSAWGIDEINVDEVPSKNNLFIVLDRSCVDVDALKEVINRANYIIVFTYPEESMLDASMFCSLPMLSKRILVHNHENNKTWKELIYVFTNDNGVRNRIQMLHYSKHLKYSKEDVEMDVMTEEEMEIVALQGQLEATEKRLKQVLEENEELRAQIETKH